MHDEHPPHRGPFIEPSTSGIGRAVRGVARRLPRALWSMLRWRLVVLAIVGVLTLVQLLIRSEPSADHSARRVDGVERIPFEAEPMPGSPGSTAPSGSTVVRVDDLDGSRLAVTDLLGQAYDWAVVDPAVRRRIVAAGDGRLVATWRRTPDGDIVVERVVAIGGD